MDEKTQAKELKEKLFLNDKNGYFKIDECEEKDKCHDNEKHRKSGVFSG